MKRNIRYGIWDNSLTRFILEENATVCVRRNFVNQTSAEAYIKHHHITNSEVKRFEANAHELPFSRIDVNQLAPLP
jgi:hydroxylamine reductase (hybrid-cluster protein)